MNNLFRDFLLLVPTGVLLGTGVAVHAAAKGCSAHKDAPMGQRILAFALAGAPISKIVYAMILWSVASRANPLPDTAARVLPWIGWVMALCALGQGLLAAKSTEPLLIGKPSPIPTLPRFTFTGMLLGFLETPTVLSLVAGMILSGAPIA